MASANFFSDAASAVASNDDHYDGSFLAGYGLFVLGVSSGCTVA